jgi:hypothetical protein
MCQSKNSRSPAACYPVQLDKGNVQPCPAHKVALSPWRSLRTVRSLIELSPSWEATNCTATQELASILWNPKFHYRVNKMSPLVPILSKINPIHTIPSYFSKIHFNIVQPPTSKSPQLSLSFWLSHQYRICIPLPPSFVLHASISSLKCSQSILVSTVAPESDMHHSETQEFAVRPSKKLWTEYEAIIRYATDTFRKMSWEDIT